MRSALRSIPPKSGPLQWVLLVLMIVIVAWAYWPGLGGGFIFDDVANIADNPALRVTSLNLDDWLVASLSSGSGPLKRPLSMLSFALNHYIWGMDPRWMKLVNLGIHCLNSLLVYVLAKQLVARLAVAGTRSSWIAPLMVATCWALHPINFMAVLYVVQRMESLAQVFVLSGLILYVSGRTDSREGMALLKILTGLIGCTALGALCKESAVLLPAYAACLELTAFRAAFTRTFLHRHTWLLYLSVLIAPALVGLSRIVPMAFSPTAYLNRPFSLAERVLTEPRVLIDYLRSIVLPDLSTLSLFNDGYPISHGLMDPPSTSLAILVLAGMGVLGWALRHRLPLASLGILWFFVAHSLTATFIPLELVFEHRNYFATVGVILTAAGFALASTSIRIRAFALVASAAFAVFLGLLTHLRAIEWSDPFRFAVSEAIKHPESPRATYVYASQMILRTGLDPRSPNVPATWRAIDMAMQAPGGNALAEQAALIFAARIKAPQKKEWWQGLQRKLREQPLGSENRAALIALNNCAVEGICRFDQNEMLETFGSALSRGPDAGILSIYGKYALWVLKDAPLASRLWKESVNRGPLNPQFRINLAMVSIGLGDFEEAERQIAALRTLGLPGEHRATADTLTARLQQARASQADQKQRNPGGQQTAAVDGNP